MTEAVKPRRIIDISSPGETAPNTSSRPILVSHKPSVQDPMVSAPTKKAENQAGESTPTSQVPTPTGTSVSPASQPTTQVAAITDQSVPQPELPQTSQTDVKQLVHDKTYFMPVSQPPRARGLPWLLVLTSALIIAAFGTYFILAP